MKRIKNFLVLGIVLFVVGYFLYQHVGDGEELLSVLSKISPLYLLLALLMQIGFYYNWILLFRNSFKMFGINWSNKEMIQNFLKFSAVSVATPLGGTAATGVYIQKAKEGNHSAIKALAGAFSATLVHYIVLTLTTSISFIIMNYMGWLRNYQVTALLLMFIVITVVGVMLNLGGVAPKVILKLFLLIQYLRNLFTNAFKLNKPILEKWAEIKAREFIEISNLTRTKLPQIAKLFKYSIFAFLFEIGTMELVFLGVGYLVQPQALFSGTSLALLFTVISPTPLGVGVVEPLLASIFSSFGIVGATSSVVSIIFRAITIWLPSLLGLAYVSRTQVRNTITNK